MSLHSEPPARYAHVDPPETMYARVRAAVDETRATALTTRTRVISALVAVAAFTTVLVGSSSALVYRRAAAGLELAIASPSHLLLVLAAVLGLTLLATAAAVHRGRGGLGPPARGLLMIACLVAPLYMLMVTMAPVHSASSGSIAGVIISPWGWRCALIAIGAFALLALTAALRRAVVTAHAVHGAAIGAAAGAWAGLGVFLFCPSGSWQHVLIGHASIPVLLTLIGALSLARALRP